MKQIVSEINKLLPKKYQFSLDMVHQTPPNESGKYVLEFLGYANSFSKDQKTLPKSLRLKCLRNSQIEKINKWINRKLFAESIEILENEKRPDCNTDFVRLRIATNMIYKLDVRKEEKEEWVQQLHEVYYERHRAIFEYYVKMIAQLPF